VADVNVDGKPDLIIANGVDNDAGVLLGNGDGTFQVQKTFATGSNSYSVAVADVNGDGRPDVVVANQGDNNASILLGDVPPTVLSINRTNPPGPITSDPSVTYTVTFNEAVTGVDPTDFALATTGSVNATTPVVVMPVNGAVYSVAINGITGTGTLGLNLVDDGSIKDAAGNPLQPGGVAAFGAQQTFQAGKPRFIATGAVNGDGKADLIVTNLYSPSVSVLLGNGDGSFQAPTTFAVGMQPFAVATADVNGDGKADLIVSNISSNSVSVLLGNGNGSFQTQQTFSTGYNPYSLVVGDVNGDGKPDLIVANTNSPSVSVLLGNGNGTFQNQFTIAVEGFNWRSIALADVNGDGKPDLIVAQKGSRVGVLLGNGNGSFQAQQTFSTGNIRYSLVVGDVNGDGKPDLIATNAGSNSVSVLLGNGNGSFQAQQTFSTGNFPYSVVVGDVNGDGKPDLIVDDVSNSVSVLLGNGNGTFQNPQTFATGSNPKSVAVVDVNGDGKPDLIVTSVHDGNISVLLGAANGNFTGQAYTIVPSLDTITDFSVTYPITLVQDPDQTHIDWTLVGTIAQLSINDSNGLTINGNGFSNGITLDYTNGNPLPNTLHLNGTTTFTINGLQGSSPLLNTTLEIGRSKVYISYASPAADPMAAVKRYLQNGYNNGAWNGIPSASPGFPGDITSIPAALNAAGTTGIGYADSADGLGVNALANSIELKYTLYGETTGGTWDTGDFNYDGSVNSADFTLMTRTYNTSLGSQAAPALSTGSGQAATSAAASASSAGQPSAPLTSDEKTSGNRVPAVQVKPAPISHPVSVPKQHKKQKR
jgi:uncharacterized protein YfaP (DUF2135 family)